MEDEADLLIADRRQGIAVEALDANGQPQAIRVFTGVSDGTMTEVRGKDLKEGTKVIAGTASATQSAQTTTSSSTPFQSGQQQQRGGQRGGF